LVGQCVTANKEWADHSVSPVTRQTLLHWGYRLTKADIDVLVPAIRKGECIIYVGVVVDNEKSAKDTAENHQKIVPECRPIFFLTNSNKPKFDTVIYILSFVNLK
jgi:hypothetical protein